MSRADVVSLLYIVAFSMFIVGLRMLRGPRTAVRGNQIAAVGMAIAIGATLAQEGVGDWGLIVLGVAIGVLAVVPIGGADMPVVISTLNAFTGLSAAAAGIALDNTALIVAGMLVGASGSILTKQMADAMNRSIANVFFAGVGTGGGGALTAPGGGGTARSTSAADVAIQLSYARLVVVVPGYGMAVAPG